MEKTSGVNMYRRDRHNLASSDQMAEHVFAGLFSALSHAFVNHAVVQQSIYYLKLIMNLRGSNKLNNFLTDVTGVNG